MTQQHISTDNYSNRRTFLKTTGSAVLGSVFLPDLIHAMESIVSDRIQPCGPASKYTPTLQAAFVRRKEDYGMWWPGQVYDGEAALKMYREQILTTGQELGMKIDLRPAPIYSIEEANQWIDQAKAEKPDGLMVVTLDRQRHAWPTVNLAQDTGIPTVVFSPIGTSFTTNTAQPSQKDGIFICSTDDFSQAGFGMKMIKAGAKLRETRFLVIKGKERQDTELQQLGTKLRYLPAQSFIDDYNRLKIDDKVKRFADWYIKNASGVTGATIQDVYNGVKSYFVARHLLEREECDGISMDCLGALASINISLPCIAWSNMNDHGIPAACEADLGACATHALVQYLFDRPGFQQDPVAETARGCLIGAHCSCPTKLNGFAGPSEPFSIINHHGKRDATIRPLWKIGQRVTVVDLISSKDDVFGGLKTVADVGDRTKIAMIFSAGTVVDNISVPPAGGCVISVMVKLDGISEVLDYPGFHQLFIYGDYQKELKSFCQLFGIERCS